jgi:hypothetical protein
MKIHYNYYKLSCTNLRTARRRVLNGGELYKFHLLLNAELETETGYNTEKSKYNYSLFAENRIKHLNELEDNCLIYAYEMHSPDLRPMYRSRREYTRDYNKMSSKSKIVYKKFNGLFRTRDIYQSTKRIDMKQ